MARYTVHVKIKHDHLGDGPSDLVVTMRGDKKILQDVENYALHYEEMSKSLATIEADLELCKKWLRDCHESKSKIGDRCLEMEAERDRLKAVLVKISEWGCNGQCYELVKTLCPCCIAKQALEVDGGKD